MYAVVISGGKQYRVEEDQVLDVELVGEEGSSVDLVPVMLVDGKTVLATPSELQDVEVKAEILGRKIKTIRLSKGTVWIAFQDICEGPRSAKDYIEICSEFHTRFQIDVVFRILSRPLDKQILICACYFLAVGNPSSYIGVLFKDVRVAKVRPKATSTLPIPPDSHAVVSWQYTFNLCENLQWRAIEHDDDTSRL